MTGNYNALKELISAKTERNSGIQKIIYLLIYDTIICICSYVVSAVVFVISEHKKTLYFALCQYDLYYYAGRIKWKA